MLHTVAPRYVYCKHQATFRSSTMLAMKTIDEIRYENLQSLIQDTGGGDLTKALEKTKSWHLAESTNKLSRQTIDQILKRRKTQKGATKGVGDELARKIEEEFRLERGWMDNPANGTTQAAAPPGALDADMVISLLDAFRRLDEHDKGLVLDFARGAAQGEDLGGIVDQLQIRTR
jgi:hypothetical protein